MCFKPKCVCVRGEFPASAKSTCIIKTGYFGVGFVVVLFFIHDMSQYLAQDFRNPLVKSHVTAWRTPWKASSSYMLPQLLSEYLPSQVAESFPESCLPPAPDHGAPPTFFPKDEFQQEASDPNSHPPFRTAVHRSFP